MDILERVKRGRLGVFKSCSSYIGHWEQTG